FHGWKTFPPELLAGRSVFSMKQDVKLLGRHIMDLGVRYLKETCAEQGLGFREIDHFLPHISSMFFRDKLVHLFEELGVDIPQEKWYINLHEVGNVGAASIFLMLDGLARSGRLRKGQRVVLMVPESARFSYAMALLTVVCTCARSAPAARRYL